MVFYLKYRPQKIKELDSGLIREKLEDALKGKLPDKIPHAFLFTGPKGLGKTSTARIIAKAINCTNRKGSEIEPCNKCASCKSINNGSNLDVLEIDAASNRGIDEIRDLREKIRLSPVSSKKKIYIIDEVHMLTTEAFNALLKTLEEPPSHAYFILCTTEPQKVPPTIISRCFHIKFTKATDEDLIHSFNRIIKGEGLRAEKQALLEIAKLSDGSFRDGAKILEELSSTSGNITSGLIEKKYKTQTINKQIEVLILSFRERNAKKGIDIIASISSEGVDFKLFNEELIGRLHQELISQVNAGKETSETKNLIELLVGAHMSLKYAVIPQLPLELALVEWCSLEVGEKGANEPPDESHFVPNYVGTSRDKHDKILKELIGEVKKENFSIAGVLRGCKLEKFDKNELVLSTNYKFHKERLNDPKTKMLIETIISKITNSKVKFSVV